MSDNGSAPDVLKDMYDGIEAIASMTESFSGANLVGGIGDKPVVFVGEGSSRALPVKFVRDFAVTHGLENKIIDYTETYDFKSIPEGAYVVLITDSGETKEVMDVKNWVMAENERMSAGEDIKTFRRSRLRELVLVTAGNVEDIVEEISIVKTGDKQRTAKTQLRGDIGEPFQGIDLDNIILYGPCSGSSVATKSVVLQTLILYKFFYRLAICQNKKGLGSTCELVNDLNETAEFMRHNLQLEVPREVIQKVIGAKNVVLAGYDRGLINELLVKGAELTKRLYHPAYANNLIHGMSPALTGDQDGAYNLVMVIDPVRMGGYLQDFYRVFTKSGCEFMPITDSTKLDGGIQEASFATVGLKVNKRFSSLCYLAWFWNLFAKVGKELGVDINMPYGVDRVGNPYVATTQTSPS